MTCNANIIMSRMSVANKSTDLTSNARYKITLQLLQYVLYLEYDFNNNNNSLKPRAQHLTRLVFNSNG